MTRLTDKLVVNNKFVGYCVKHNEEKLHGIIDYDFAGYGKTWALTKV